MAIKNYGYTLATLRNGYGAVEPMFWKRYPTYSLNTLTFSTKKDQLMAVVDAYRRGLTKKQFELVNSRATIDRYGEVEGDDKSHGVVKPSSSKKYWAIFVPYEWCDGYSYDRYYVSDKGSLIPVQRY